MELFRLALLALLTSCAHSLPEMAVHPLPSDSFEGVEPVVAESSDDYEALGRRALAILFEGARSADPDHHLLAVYGAGVSAHEEAVSVLLGGLVHRDGRSQLAALHFLSKGGDEASQGALRHAMGSGHLIARLEAAYNLAMRRDPMATSQVSALMAKVDVELRPLFPQLFAMIGDAPSTQELRMLLHGHDNATRHAAILACAQHGRDDLLPEIRSLAAQLAPEQQEACAFAMGVLQDEKSASVLEGLSHSSHTSVALTADLALARLGRLEKIDSIATRAKAGDLFAVTALGEFLEGRETLAELARNGEGDKRLNATIALLRLRDARSLEWLPDYLIRDSSDLAFSERRSPGRSLNIFTIVNSAHSALGGHPYAYEMAIRQRERLIYQASELSDESFIPFANRVLHSGQSQLLPEMIQALERRRSAEAVELLKFHQAKLTRPLVRWYCNLALYRMGEEGPYGDNLLYWIERQSQQEMIQFRLQVPWELDPTPHELTPTETSRLLIESFEALAGKRNEEAIEALRKAIHEGHPSNRYPLAGLLLRALS